MARPHRPPSHGIERIPENLYRDPIDFILADHYRQRTVCDFLDTLVRSASDDRAMCAAAVLEYLENDLPHHVRDEEEGLFPRLKRRCPAGEDIRGVLKILSDEHEKDEQLLPDLVGELRAIEASSHPGDTDRFARLATVFTESLRRHLAWEDATVLRLARQWLMPDDLVELGHDMARRRAVAYPE